MQKENAAKVIEFTVVTQFCMQSPYQFFDKNGLEKGKICL